MYIDWVAIAASAGNNQNLKSDLINYLKNNPVDSSVVTDYERRAIALMSMGIDPYEGTDVNYIKKITDSFNGEQIRDEDGEDLVNNDIFGLIVLQNAGYKNDDTIISKIISFILSKQSSDGSWGSVDMTAAGIMSLKNFDSDSLVSDAVSKAEEFLIKSQNKDDGGFYNSSSTSWAIQALSLDHAFDLEVNKAIEYLTDKQQADGGMEGSDVPSRVWATSYSIPAVSLKTWNDILDDFSKKEEIQNTPQVEISEKEIKEETSLPLKIDLLKKEIITEKKDESVVVVKKEIKSDSIKNNNIINKKLIENTTLVKEKIPENESVQKNNSSFWHPFIYFWSLVKSPFIWLWSII
jgi:hypothetical protein